MSIFTPLDIADAVLTRFAGIDELANYALQLVSQYEDVDTLLAETKLHDKISSNVDKYSEYMTASTTGYLLKILLSNMESAGELQQRFEHLHSKASFAEIIGVFTSLLNYPRKIVLPISSAEELYLCLGTRDRLYFFVKSIVEDFVQHLDLLINVKASELESLRAAHKSIADFYSRIFFEQWTEIARMTAHQKGVRFEEQYAALGRLFSKQLQSS